jgi:hypothetical protein
MDWNTVITIVIVAALCFLMMRGCGMGCGGCGMGSRQTPEGDENRKKHDRPLATG